MSFESDCSLYEILQLTNQHRDWETWLVLNTSFYISAGMMYFPVPWWNKLGDGLVLGQHPDPSWVFTHVGREVWQPDEVCEGPTSGDEQVCTECSVTTCATHWFTNHTYIPGEPTLGGYSMWGTFLRRSPPVSLSCLKRKTLKLVSNMLNGLNTFVTS